MVFLASLVKQLIGGSLIGLSLSYLLSRLFITLSVKSGLMLDVPHRESRRIHENPTPRIGGIVLLFSYVLTLALVLPPAYWHNPQLQGFVVGVILTPMIGIIDDLQSIKGQVKLVWQILVIALVVVVFRVQIPFVNIPLSNNVLEFSAWQSAVISTIWILSATNVINFADGVDGLALSLAIAFLLILLVVAILFQQDILTTATAVLLACCLGFLPFNWHRAKSFLGDTGSMFLGFCIGALSLLAGAKMATVLLVLGLPFLDVANTFLIRLSRGQSLFAADREHLHYRLIAKGWSSSQTILLITGVSLLFGIVALTNSTVLKMLGLIALSVVSIAIIRWSRR